MTVARKKSLHHAHIPARKSAADVRRQNIIVCFFLVLMVLAVFGQTARFDFVNYDDDTYVYANPAVENGLTLKGMAWALTYGDIGHWHPLTWLTHMADYQAYGLWAGGHHLTSVALHAFAAVFLFLALRSLTGKLWRSAFVAAVFAVHPLRAESVVWIAERKDVLSGMFFMVTLWAYARYVRQPSRGRYALVVLWFGLGLLSKDMLVTLPLILLLLDWWPLKRFSISDFQFPIFFRLVREKIPLFLLSLGSCVVTAMVPEKIAALDRLPLGLRVENAVVSYVTYLRQMIFPAGLATPYPNPANGLPPWEFFLAFVLLAAISAGVLVCWKTRPYLLVGWLWYLGMLVPVIGIIQISNYAAHADRYTYLSEIGPAIALTWLVAEWSVQWRQRRLVLGGLMVVIIGALMFCGYTQVSYWRDSETLWTRALARTSGNSVASYNLANDLHDHGHPDDAIAYYQKALAMNPDYYQAECNLGNVLVEQGQADQAIVCFQKVLAAQPDYAKAHYGLGNAWLQKGQPDQAAASFQKALAIQPDYAKAHYSLGNILFDSGKLDEAVKQYQAALATEPGFVEARFNLGNSMLNLGRLDEAIADYQKVLALQPDYTGARINLGAALMQSGRAAAAMDEYRQVLATRPENVDALNNLALALATCPSASLRDGNGALMLAQKAVQLGGVENPVLLRTLAAAYAESGRYADAAETARHALRLAVAAGNVVLAGTLQNEINLYDAGTPVRDVKP